MWPLSFGLRFRTRQFGVVMNPSAHTPALLERLQGVQYVVACLSSTGSGAQQTEPRVDVDIVYYTRVRRGGARRLKARSSWYYSSEMSLNSGHTEILVDALNIRH